MRGATETVWSVVIPATFLLTRPMRGATCPAVHDRREKGFLLTRPMRGATMKQLNYEKEHRISTHTPHAGRDQYEVGKEYEESISTHTPHAGRDLAIFAKRTRSTISTHTPHAGRDPLRPDLHPNGAHFYSHAPCGARLISFFNFTLGQEFLLTRPMRGATLLCIARSFRCDYFYSHAPCGARQPGVVGTEALWKISTHTPHAGRDVSFSSFSAMDLSNFYSHAPCGARPKVTAYHQQYATHFYSHAPCGARLPLQAQAHLRLADFYSHAPCGARPGGTLNAVRRVSFLLTRPMRGATVLLLRHRLCMKISTHTPHAGRDT